MTEQATARGILLPDWMELIVRFLVGGTFVYASFDKILHPEAFALAISHYRMLPAELLHVFALTLSWLELVVGLCMVLGFARRGASAIVVGMLIMFIGAISFALSRDLDISCGCFSTEGGHIVGLSLIFRDIALMAGALVLWACKGVKRTF